MKRQQPEDATGGQNHAELVPMLVCGVAAATSINPGDGGALSIQLLDNGDASATAVSATLGFL
ncbi:MAG TPA: hypothetical protein VLD59_12735 [Steroidobacteraceae bacterium]|nr:hypothetical protein [Steroidobacteraceae bacterium]